MADHQFGELRGGIAVIARRKKSFRARAAVPAADWKRNYNTVANSEIRNTATCLDNLTHELVAENVP
jgi:hypothetical protein